MAAEVEASLSCSFSKNCGTIALRSCSFYCSVAVETKDFSWKLAKNNNIVAGFVARNAGFIVIARHESRCRISREVHIANLYFYIGGKWKRLISLSEIVVFSRKFASPVWVWVLACSHTI